MTDEPNDNIAVEAAVTVAATPVTNDGHNHLRRLLEWVIAEMKKAGLSIEEELAKI